MTFIYRLNGRQSGGILALNDNDAIQMMQGNISPSEQNFLPQEDDTNEVWSAWI